MLRMENKIHYYLLSIQYFKSARTDKSSYRVNVKYQTKISPVF